MPIVDGKKMACENCIRGHRSAVCPHQYRPLFEVRSRGRPKGCTIDKETGKWTKPTAKQPRKSRCCGEAGCHCVVIDNDIIEKRDCQGCPPGLAQRPLELPKDLNVPEAAAGSSSQAVAAAAPLPGFSFDVEFDCSCEGGCSCAGCPKHTGSEANGAPSDASSEPASCCASKKAAPQATASAQGATNEPSCSSCLPCVIAPFDGPPAPRAPTFASARDLASFHRNHFDNEERRAWFREQIEQASSANIGSSGSSNDLAPTTTATTPAQGGKAAAANADVPWGERVPGETDEAWQRRLGFNYLTPDSVRIFDAAREFREERQKLREREEAEEEGEDDDDDDDEPENRPLPAASAVKSAGSGSNVVAGGQDDLEALRLRALSGRRNKKARTDE